MNGSVHASSPQQTGIGCIHHRLNIMVLGDIPFYGCEQRMGPGTGRLLLPVHMHILSYPVRIPVSTGFTYPTAMIQIIRKLYDNIRKLQIPLPFLLQSSISNQRTQNISCHRSCGIAVTAMIYS